MLDQAFEALKTYDWGTDPAVLAPIDEAIVKCHGQEGARAELESRLAGVLTASVPRDAKDYACRKLMMVGSAASVPTLAGLLPDKDLSHMARFALERNPSPEAGAALREYLPKLSGALKVGAIASLGMRREAASVAAIAALLADADGAIAAAAALALGQIRTSEAAKALSEAKSSDPRAQLTATDARLSCAERLLAEGEKGTALALYKSLTGENQPKHVRLAATRGVLACAGKKE